MKGVILAGGTGSRLHPLTKVTNKCLLPVHDRPMIYYPIQTLVDSGIKDILLVCGGNAAGEFLRILGNGEAFGLRHLHYTYQPEPKGIADALSLAEEFVDGEPMVVILADNLVEKPFPDVVAEFEQNPVGARIFLTTALNPEWYGVAVVDDNGNVLSIEEKPKKPTSNWIVAGIYIYDSSVWGRIAKLSPSARGELEITDLNNLFLKDRCLWAYKMNGWWMDAGESLDVYAQVCHKVYEWHKRLKFDQYIASHRNDTV
jgi:glucose-1-phosphate thymidylyltransferase